LAKVGNTSIEWILTRRHWENGSEDQQRLSPDFLETARLLREVLDDQRAGVDEALRIVREAVQVLSGDILSDSPAPVDRAAMAESLAGHSRATLRLLENAWKIQRAVLRRVLEDADDRLRRSPVLPTDAPGRPDGPTPNAPGRSRGVR